MGRNHIAPFLWASGMYGETDKAATAFCITVAADFLLIDNLVPDDFLDLMLDGIHHPDPA